MHVVKNIRKRVCNFEANWKGWNNERMWQVEDKEIKKEEKQNQWDK